MHMTLFQTTFITLYSVFLVAYSFRFHAQYCTWRRERVSDKPGSWAPILHWHYPWEWTTRRSDTERLYHLHGGRFPHLWELWVQTTKHSGRLPVFRLSFPYFSNAPFFYPTREKHTSTEFSLGYHNVCCLFFQRDLLVHLYSLTIGRIFDRMMRALPTDIFLAPHAVAVLS